MRHTYLLTLLVFTLLYGCSSSKPTALMQSPEPQWFKTAMEKSQAFYHYHNLPAPDSVRQRRLTISLKEGIEEQLAVGDILELAFYSKKLSLKDSEQLADALSALLQGIEACKRSPDSAQYITRLRDTYAALAVSLAHRADSLVLLIHKTINALDEAYRQHLQTLTKADARTSIFFAGNYEKIKRLLAIELELIQFALEEYRRGSERLRLVGLSDETITVSRQKFLIDARKMLSRRMISLENALAQFNAQVKETSLRSLYVEATHHYNTLLRLSKENFTQLQTFD